MQAEPNSLHSEIMRKEALRLPRLPIQKRRGGGGVGGGGVVHLVTSHSPSPNEALSSPEFLCLCRRRHCHC